MARITIPVVTLLPEQINADPGTTAIDPASGHFIAPTTPIGRVLLEVKNTAGGAKNVTFKAGANPPAQRAGLGDLVISIPAGATKWFTVTSNRFGQADGSVAIDCENAMTGTLRALSAPKAY